MVRYLFDIPVQLDRAAVIQALRLDKRRESVPDADTLIHRVLPLIRAKAVLRECRVDERGDKGIALSGVSFSSRVLSRKVGPGERLFVYVITIGPDLERKAQSGESLLDQYYLECLGDMALLSARQRMKEGLEKEYGIRNLANLSPGSLEEWPVTEQTPLFLLMGEGPAKIGVRLSESMLMIPRKSLSGVYFSAEEGFSSCQLCPRADCIGRKAPYDESLKSRILD